MHYFQIGRVVPACVQRCTIINDANCKQNAMTGTWEAPFQFKISRLFGPSSHSTQGVFFKLKNSSHSTPGVKRNSRCIWRQRSVAVLLYCRYVTVVCSVLRWCLCWIYSVLCCCDVLIVLAVCLMLQLLCTCCVVMWCGVWRVAVLCCRDMLLTFYCAVLLYCRYVTVLCSVLCWCLCWKYSVLCCCDVLIVLAVCLMLLVLCCVVMWCGVWRVAVLCCRDMLPTFY